MAVILLINSENEEIKFFQLNNTVLIAKYNLIWSDLMR